MTNYSYGDVILVKFTFSEGGDAKLRPALVLSIEDYHNSRQELIMAAITSNVKRQLLGDTKLSGWKSAGLLHASLVTGIIRTIKQDMVVRRLGTLSKRDIFAVVRNLNRVFGPLAKL